MKIKKIEREIHSRGGDLENRPHHLNLLDPRATGKVKDFGGIRKEEAWKNGEEYTKKQKKYLLNSIIGILILIFCLTAGYFFYLYKSRAFAPENIILSIDTPATVESGQIFPVKLLFHNNNRVDLHDCRLKFLFPANTEIVKLSKEPSDNDKRYLFFDLGKIKKGANGTIELELKITEKEQAMVDFNMILEYKLNSESPVNSQEKRQSLELKKSKIGFELEATRQASSGNLVEYLARIKNNTHNNLDNLELSLTYPSGFEYSGSSLVPTGEKSNIFKIPTLPSTEEMEISIKGILKGSVTENKEVLANIKQEVDGKLLNLVQDSARTEMINSPLLINQKFIISHTEKDSQNIDPGELLSLVVEYQNSSDIPMKEAIILVDLESRVLKKETVEVEKGHFDPNEMTVTWKGGEVPELTVLEPMEKGEFRISFEVADHLPSENIDDKNFTIDSRAQIDSPDVPTPIGSNKLISSNEASVKLNTKVFFNSDGFFNDNFITNSGPLPPQVKEKTTYTIHWKIININNDLKDVTLKASLPDYVSWENKIYPETNKNISYNSRTNEIIWKVGDVSAQTGTLNEAKEVVFQIGLTPNENQVGQEVILLNEASFSGIDSFTNKNYNFSEKSITTKLENDISVSSGESKVVE